ncbi:hypothetical protein [Candidatus Symbiopectobacterium sp.]|uniref:hypothetical protein n=1 Tax=Candidatus Symbiopectobacterium sp. TaxID=2816440 RepID=UPI0025B81890|nr:hypothetical protein [Candidatus Symbiopectobacterium sp.]
MEKQHDYLLFNKAITFTTAFLRLVIHPPARSHDERLSGLILAEVNYGIHHLIRVESAATPSALYGNAKTSS